MAMVRIVIFKVMMERHTLVGMYQCLSCVLTQ
jgi:hypothetical protein